MSLGGHVSPFREHTDFSLRPLHKPGASLFLPVPVASCRNGQEKTNCVTTAPPRLGYLAEYSVVGDGASPSGCRAVAALGVGFEVFELHLDIARRCRHRLLWRYVVVSGDGPNQNRQSLVHLLQHALDAAEPRSNKVLGRTFLQPYLPRGGG
uniref:Uncharacterized protein n=1 Tax=Peronospora matthiolae TaxID=2874970 RepID=A0AAV1TIS3_9STRA